MVRKCWMSLATYTVWRKRTYAALVTASQPTRERTSYEGGMHHCFSSRTSFDQLLLLTNYSVWPQERLFWQSTKNGVASVFALAQRLPIESTVESGGRQCPTRESNRSGSRGLRSQGSAPDLVRQILCPPRKTGFHHESIWGRNPRGAP